MHSKSKYWNDSTNMLIQLTNHYRHHLKNIQLLRLQHPHPPPPPLKISHHKSLLKEHPIRQENDRLMNKIISITQRPSSIDSNKSSQQRKSLNQAWHKKQQQRISLENKQLLARLNSQQSSYKRQNPAYSRHKDLITKISKFSNYNQNRLRSIVKSLNLRPEQASYLPSLSRVKQNSTKELGCEELVSKVQRRRKSVKEKEQSPFRLQNKYWSRYVHEK